MSAMAMPSPSAMPTGTAPRPSGGAAPKGCGCIADPYVPGLHWVPINLAAEALGLGERALRMKGEDLKAAGFAKQLSPTVGSQTKWHFSTRFDARLAALVTAQAASTTGEAPISPTDTAASEAFERFRAAPKNRQNAAVAKCIAVKLYRQWRRSPTTILSNKEHQASLLRTIAAHGGTAPNSMQRLWEWNNLVASLNLHTDAGFQAACWELLDRRGGNREAGYSGEAWDLFQATYLRDNKLSVRQCWEITGAEARKRGWTWVSLSRAKQLVHERLPASLRTLAREGEETWQREHLPSVIQDPAAWHAGQCWETDHTRCDFFVRTVRGGNVVAERPWITAFLDRRSRRLMGWSMGLAANSDSIRAALHDALRRDDVSVPEFIVLDNGKDFASEEFSGITKQARRRGEDPAWSGLLALLGIAPQFATPYNHNGKARIERFFGVVHQGFDRTLDSWSGSGGGSGGRDQDKIDALLADPIKLPTLDEVRERFRGWVEHYNHNADRNIEDLVDEGGRRLSPAEWYQAKLPAFRPLASKARVLTMLEHRWSKPVTPGKNGVPIKIAGRTLTFGQHHPEIQNLVGSGRKVHVTFNPSDLNAVRVYDERFALICEAELNTRHGGPTDTPLARHDLQKAIARQRQHKRDAKRQVDIAAAVLPIGDLALIEQREREVAETKARLKAEGHDNPPPMRLVNAPLSGTTTDDETSRVPLRKAAGAEHDEFHGLHAQIQRAMNPASTGLDADDGNGPFSLLDALPGGVPDRDDAASGLEHIDILRELGA